MASTTAERAADRRSARHRRGHARLAAGPIRRLGPSRLPVWPPTAARTLVGRPLLVRSSDVTHGATDGSCVTRRPTDEVERTRPSLTVDAMSDVPARPFGFGFDVADPGHDGGLLAGPDVVRAAEDTPLTSIWCDPEREGPGIYLHKVPEARPPGKNRVHPELWVDDLELARARVLELGGGLVADFSERLPRRARHDLHGLQRPRGQRFLPRAALTHRPFGVQSVVEAGHRHGSGSKRAASP